MSDKKNLKYVVNRLLLIREGMNYLYALEAPEMNGKAEGLAVTLTGFLGMPRLRQLQSTHFYWRGLTEKV